MRITIKSKASAKGVDYAEATATAYVAVRIGRKGPVNGMYSRSSSSGNGSASNRQQTSLMGLIRLSNSNKQRKGEQ